MSLAALARPRSDQAQPGPGPDARGAPPRARPDRRAADPRPGPRGVPGARPRRRHRARPGPALRAGRRRPPDRLERHRPDDDPARPGPRPGARPDGVAPARRLAVDDVRDRRPAQGRRRRGRRVAIGHLATQRGNRLGIVTFGGRRDRRIAGRGRSPGCSALLLAAAHRRRPSRSGPVGARRRRRTALRFVERGRAARRARRPRLRLPRPARLARVPLGRGRGPPPGRSPSRSTIRAKTTCPTSAS